MTTQGGLKPIRVRQPVFDAVKVWQERRKTLIGTIDEKGVYPPAESILHSIPRRQQSIPPDERKLWIPNLEPLVIRNSISHSLRRLFGWIRVMLTIAFGNFFDRVLRRDTIERRAVRFRRALERAGGTFVKLGQQLAMRV